MLAEELGDVEAGGVEVLGGRIAIEEVGCYGDVPGPGEAVCEAVTVKVNEAALTLCPSNGVLQSILCKLHAKHVGEIQYSRVVFGSRV